MEVPLFLCISPTLELDLSFRLCKEVPVPDYLCMVLKTHWFTINSPKIIEFSRDLPVRTTIICKGKGLLWKKTRRPQTKLAR